MNRVRALLIVCLGIFMPSLALLATPPAVQASGYVFVTQWGTSGSGDGQFSRPTGVATDAVGNVYVADYGNNRIQKFTSTGTYLLQSGTLGNANGQFQF